MSSPVQSFIEFINDADFSNLTENNKQRFFNQMLTMEKMAFEIVYNKGYQAAYRKEEYDPSDVFYCFEEDTNEEMPEIHKEELPEITNPEITKNFSKSNESFAKQPISEHTQNILTAFFVRDTAEKAIKRVLKDELKKEVVAFIAENSEPNSSVYYTYITLHKIKKKFKHKPSVDTPFLNELLHDGYIRRLHFKIQITEKGLNFVKKH